MKKASSFGLLVLVCVVLATPAFASGVPYYMNFNGSATDPPWYLLSGDIGAGGGASDHLAGLFAMSSSAPISSPPPGSPPPTPYNFNVICMDAAEYIYGTQHYYVLDSLANYPYLPDPPPPNGISLDAAKKGYIGELFAVAWTDVGSGASITYGTIANTTRLERAAAMQWALWEIVRETNSTLTLASGAVYVNNTSDRVAQLGEYYLGQLNPSNTKSISVLTPAWWNSAGNGGAGQWETAYGQELAFTPYPPDEIPIPEPQSVILMCTVGGALGLAFLRRKRVKA